LLDEARGGPAQDGVVLALDTMERLRARTLLDAMEAARAAPTSTPGPLHDQRAEALARIARVQRRLLGRIGEAERAEALAELAGLERAEEDWRDRIARAQPQLAAGVSAERPRLVELQAALGADEALLAFQTWSRRTDPELPYADGSSWVIAVTRAGARPFRIADAAALERSVRMFVALLL